MQIHNSSHKSMDFHIRNNTDPVAMRIQRDKLNEVFAHNGYVSVCKTVWPKQCTSFDNDARFVQLRWMVVRVWEFDM